MKLTFNWLMELVELPEAVGSFGPDELAERLTHAGLEVEAVRPLSGDTGAVIVEVRDVQPHPDADRLSVCEVHGDGEPVRIVCGAPNVRPNMKTALLRVGSVLPSGQAIERRPIRGVPSEGMLCSEKELELSDDHHGIMDLPADAPTGASLHDYLGLNDWMVEVSVTPNRGDCLSVLGLAREIAALTGGKLRVPAIPDHLRDHPPTIPVSVEIVDPVLCPRYSARLIHGLRPAPSPPWLRFRLEACGIRSINHIVDVTNYVMLEAGQPLHAFDARRIASRRIVVRTAGESSALTTLDGSERALHPDDLLICDGDTPAALAGVMGGAGSEVTGETESVLLESAHFDPLTIRRTAKRMGMHTEASHRFERGVDPEGTRYAMDRAVALWEAMGEAQVVSGFADAYPGARKPADITLRYASVKRVLGIELPPERIRGIIESLGIELKRSSGQDLVVSPPSFRFDLTREADIVEELARIHGYDNIPATLPAVRMGAGQGDALLRWMRKTRSLLNTAGLSEVVTLPFCSPKMNQTLPGLWGENGKPVRVTNPLRQETDEMRLGLLPGLIENLHDHAERRSESAMIFELNKVFSLGGDGAFTERMNVAGLIHGRRPRRGLKVESRAFVFADMKGIVEDLLEGTGCADSRWTAEDRPPILHPGRFATVSSGGARMGYVGEISPRVREELDLPPFFLFELDFEALVHYARPDFKVRPIPRFPSVERDLAIVVAEDFPSQTVIDWVRELDRALIERVDIFDEYTGAPISEGKKSLAYKVFYRSPERTLTDHEVNAVHEDLTRRLCAAFDATLR